MKKTIILVLILTCLCGCLAGCGESESTSVSTSKTTNSISEVQEVCREAQNAWEAGDIQATRKAINKMIEMSEDTMYSQKERLTAQYAATYINSGVNLDYIIKNDNEWYQQQDFSDFLIFHEFIFTEIMNGNIHTDEIGSYIGALVQCTKPIYDKYTELTR